MFFAGFIVAPMALMLEAMAHPPGWVHAAIWLPLTVALCAWMLRPFKATLFALQWATGAEEGRLVQPTPMPLAESPQDPKA
jgi:uncharacterized protein (DUF983 family)